MKLMPFRATVFIFILVIFSALAAAQTTTTPRERETPAASVSTGVSTEVSTEVSKVVGAVVRQAGTTASEDFELNIGDRRITENDFEASTEVASGAEGEGRGLDLRVGVMVRASQIDVLLRNVQGRVRFRANLDPVLRLLNLRRVGPSATTPITPPAPQTNPSP
ncbi:MAG: hypothetical protein H0T60_03970 [Acidobacteria bacterium]|nr:hypothetical protein [Acidobacteriota bacterium]